MRQPLVGDVVKISSPQGTASDSWNIVALSASFFFLFGSYSTLKGYVPTTLPGFLGFEALLALYASYFVALFFVPAICNRIGDRPSMVIGALFYLAFIASLVWGDYRAIIAAAVLVGFGAALLWVAATQFLSACCTEDNRGLYAGVFWGCLQMSSVFGPLASYLILSFVDQHKGSQGTEHDTWSRDRQHDIDMVMYISFTGAAGLAVVVLLLLRRPSSNLTDGSSLQARTAAHSVSRPISLADEIWQPLVSVANLCCTRDISLMLAACAFTGFGLSFVTGEYFRLTMLLPCSYVNNATEAEGSNSSHPDMAWWGHAPSGRREGDSRWGELSGPPLAMGGAVGNHTGAWPYNRPCAQQYVGKSQSCML